MLLFPGDVVAMGVVVTSLPDVRGAVVSPPSLVETKVCSVVPSSLPPEVKVVVPPSPLLIGADVEVVVDSPPPPVLVEAISVVVISVPPPLADVVEVVPAAPPLVDEDVNVLVTSAPTP